MPSLPDSPQQHKPGAWTRFPLAILSHDGLEPAAKLVYCALSYQAWRHRHRSSYAQLAALTRLSKRHIQRSIIELIAHDLLVARSNGRGRALTWFLPLATDQNPGQDVHGGVRHNVSGTIDSGGGSTQDMMSACTTTSDVHQASAAATTTTTTDSARGASGKLPPDDLATARDGAHGHGPATAPMSGTAGQSQRPRPTTPAPQTSRPDLDPTPRLSPLALDMLNTIHASGRNRATLTRRMAHATDADLTKAWDAMARAQPANPGAYLTATLRDLAEIAQRELAAEEDAS